MLKLKSHRRETLSLSNSHKEEFTLPSERALDLTFALLFLVVLDFGTRFVIISASPVKSTIIKPEYLLGMTIC